MKHLLLLISRTALVVAHLAFAATAMAMDSPQGILTGTLPDGIGAKKRIAIATFTLQFVTRQSVESKKTNDVYHARIAGLDADSMQKIADGAYDQFAADLSAAGFTVVESGEVLSHPAAAELVKVGRKSPTELVEKSLRKSSQLVAAKGLPLILHPVQDVKLDKYATEAAEGTNVQLLGADVQNKYWLRESEVFGLASIYGAQYKMAETLDAAVINVRLTLSLVNIGIREKLPEFTLSALGKSREHGVVLSNPRLVESGTVFSFVHNNQVKAMAAKKPIFLAGLTPEITHQGDGRVTGDGGLIGSLFDNAGDGERGTALVKVNADQLSSALNGGASVAFKDLAQTLSVAK